MIQGLVAEVERRHGVQVEEVAAVGPRQVQRVHVLDPYWARTRAGSWASTEGKRGQGRAGPLADVDGAGRCWRKEQRDRLHVHAERLQRVHTYIYIHTARGRACPRLTSTRRPKWGRRTWADGLD